METVNKGGRPRTVNATTKIEYLTDTNTASELRDLVLKTQRTRNSLMREAVNDLLNKYRHQTQTTENRV